MLSRKKGLFSLAQHTIHDWDSADDEDVSAGANRISTHDAATLAVLAPPYHPRLDRPALDQEGGVAGQRRAEFKKAHDDKVFGSRYF